jgi:hypothetical protein
MWMLRFKEDSIKTGNTMALVQRAILIRAPHSRTHHSKPHQLDLSNKPLTLTIMVLKVRATQVEVAVGLVITVARALAKCT